MTRVYGASVCIKVCDILVVCAIMSFLVRSVLRSAHPRPACYPHEAIECRCSAALAARKPRRYIRYTHDLLAPSTRSPSAAEKLVLIERRQFLNAGALHATSHKASFRVSSVALLVHGVELDLEHFHATEYMVMAKSLRLWSLGLQQRRLSVGDVSAS